jgi:hypothetical protein
LGGGCRSGHKRRADDDYRVDASVSATGSHAPRCASKPGPLGTAAPFQSRTWFFCAESPGASSARATASGTLPPLKRFAFSAAVLASWRCRQIPWDEIRDGIPSRAHAAAESCARRHPGGPGVRSCGTEPSIPGPIRARSERSVAGRFCLVFLGNTANSVESFVESGVRLLRAGYRRPGEGTAIPVIAHMICQSCGAHCEAAAGSNGSSATRCQCGGMRQVVRIVRHARGEQSASSQELERNVQARADDETRTPGGSGH